MSPALAHGEHLTRQIIGLAMRVHRRIGPGLLEAVYHQCLCHELSQARIPFAQNVRLPILYDGIAIESAYTADIIVRDECILELKSVTEDEVISLCSVLTEVFVEFSRCSGLDVADFGIHAIPYGHESIVGAAIP